MKVRIQGLCGVSDLPMCVLRGQRQQDSDCHVWQFNDPTPNSPVPLLGMTRKRTPSLYVGISSPNHRLQEKQIQDRVPPRSSAEATVSQNWGWEWGEQRSAHPVLTQSVRSGEDCGLFWCLLAVRITQCYFCSILEAMKLKN